MVAILAYVRPALRAGLLTLLLGTCALLKGNDSAAAIGAGGLQLRREARISMERERLTISLEKVTVEYEFLNQTDHGITTEVAFPIPPHTYYSENVGRTRGFPYFRVWVDGQEIKYSIDAKATLDGRDYTALLRKLGITIETFGDCDLTESSSAPSNEYQVAKLPTSERSRLHRFGLIDQDNAYNWPNWTVVKTYHWTQRFPPRTLVRVRHEYEPETGSEQIPVDYIGPAMKVIRGEAPRDVEKEVISADVLHGIVHQFRHACLGPQKASEFQSSQVDFVFSNWVEYILTTANSWKTPIKDFELVVDLRNPWGGDPVHVSLCWEGQLEKSDGTYLIARKKDFIPKSELAVYYFRD